MGTTDNRGYPYPSPYTAAQDVRQAIEDLALGIDTDMETINNQIGLSINAPSVSLSLSSQPVPVGVAGLDLTWDTVHYDSDAMFFAPTPDLITFNTAGVFLLTTWVAMDPTADAAVRDVKLAFVTDGAPGPSPVSRTSRMHETASTTFGLTVPYPVILAGETLRVHVTHDDDAPRDVIAGYLNVVRMGRLDPL